MSVFYVTKHAHSSCIGLLHTNEFFEKFFEVPFQSRYLPKALALPARMSLLDMLQLKLCLAYRVMRAEGLICERHKEMMSSLKQIEICICSLELAGLSQ